MLAWSHGLWHHFDGIGVVLWAGMSGFLRFWRSGFGLAGRCWVKSLHAFWGVFGGRTGVRVKPALNPKCKVGSRRQRSNYGALVEGGPRGPGAGLYLGRAAMRALEAISTGCRNSKELVFQQSERKINQQIKAAAATAGLDRDNTGLSPRVGVAQTSALRVGDCGPS